MNYDKLPQWSINSPRDFTSFNYGLLDDSVVPSVVYNTLFVSLFEGHNTLSSALTLKDNFTVPTSITSQSNSQVFRDSINILGDGATTDVSVVEIPKGVEGEYLLKDIKPLMDRDGNPIKLQYSHLPSGCGLSLPNLQQSVTKSKDGVIGIYFKYYITVPSATARWKVTNTNLKTSISIDYPDSSRLIGSHIDTLSAKMSSNNTDESVFYRMEHNNPKIDLGETYSVSQNITWTSVGTSASIGPHVKGSPRGLPRFRNNNYLYANIFIPLPLDTLLKGVSPSADITITNISTFLGGGGGTASSNPISTPMMIDKSRVSNPRFSLENAEGMKYIPKGFGLYDVGSFTSPTDTGRSSLLLTLSSLSYIPEYTPMWLFSGNSDYQSFFYSNKDIEGTKKHYKVASESYTLSEVSKRLTEQEVDPRTSNLATKEHLTNLYVSGLGANHKYQAVKFPAIYQEDGGRGATTIYANGSSDTIASSIVPSIPNPTTIDSTKVFLLYGTRDLYENIITNEGLWALPEFPKDKTYAGTVLANTTWGKKPTKRPPIIFGKGRGVSDVSGNIDMDLVIKGHTTRVSSTEFRDVITLSLLSRDVGYSVDSQDIPYTPRNYPKVTVTYRRNLQGAVFDLRATSSSTLSGSYDYLKGVLSETDTMYGVDIPKQQLPLVLWSGTLATVGNSLMWYKGMQGGHSYTPGGSYSLDYDNYAYLRFTVQLSTDGIPNRPELVTNVTTFITVNPFRGGGIVDFTTSVFLPYRTWKHYINDEHSLGEIALRFYTTQNPGTAKTNVVQLTNMTYHNIKGMYSTTSTTMFKVLKVEGTNHIGWEESKAQSCYTFTTPTQNKY